MEFTRRGGHSALRNPHFPTPPLKFLLPSTFILLPCLLLAAPDPSPTPALTAEATPALAEKIQNKSPDGKYALRIGYDAAMNESISEPENEIASQAIQAIAIVSLPRKEIARDLTDDVTNGGNNFHRLKLLWSSDSRWCAFYCSFPRIGYTSVFHLESGKWERAHPPDALNVPTKDDVRNEHIAPVRWVRPGILELSVERVLRGEASGDGVNGFTARFDGKGKFKILKKKR